MTAKLLRILALVSMALAGVLFLATPGLARAQTLTGHWAFDEGSGTTAADSSGGSNPLTLQGGATWAPGAVGPSALSVSGNGSQQYAQSAAPVIDTTQSFTVSAWVYLNNIKNANDYQTFVSQDGSQISGFFLQLRGDTHQFAFTRPAYDSPKALGIIATDSAVIPQPDEWYHLAGVYDASAQTISLYVNGRLAQTQSYVPNWSADGSLAVGRGLFAGNPADFVSGRVDDVRTYSGALSAGAIAQLAGPGRLSIDASQRGATINPTQFGAFLEEINHSADGGLYAELIRNRDLKESSTTPVAWSAIGAPGAGIALDSDDPLTKANPVSLKLTVPQDAGAGRVGVANSGYWGVPVKPSTSYRVSFYGHASTASPPPLTVDLESNSGEVWATANATATMNNFGGRWTRYTATLHTGAQIPSSLENRFVISTPAASAAGSTLWFTFVSLFPPTYDNARNGFRIDLMRKLAALHPGYFRVPGGNYLEGDTIDTRFNWETTVGPLEGRPGHFNSAWGYWSQDGMGLLEYLELAEELHAQPLLAVWTGYTLTGTVVPQSQLEPYVKEAVDEIHYATDPVSTTLGQQRAADGHPAPFPLKMVEVGNEDFFDTSGSYAAYRWPMFANAIKAAFPQLKLVATTAVTNPEPDVVDEHYYNDDPNYFAANAHLFDDMSRSQPKVIVGEYATTQGTPTGTLADALGESAFLTGLERNADLVIGASYAPLLVNVNAPSWPTNLIGYDALHSYGSPSYWAQRMLANGLGDHVIGSSLVSGTGTLFEVATQSSGHTYVVVVNDGSRAAVTDVTLAGLSGGAGGGTATVLTGDPAAQNSLANPRAVSPRMHGLSQLGTTFRYRFAANSVTVLDLSTAAASAASRSSKGAQRRAGRFRFTMSKGDPRLPHRARRVRRSA